MHCLSPARIFNKPTSDSYIMAVTYLISPRYFLFYVWPQASADSIGIYGTVLNKIKLFFTFLGCDITITFFSKTIIFLEIKFEKLNTLLISCLKEPPHWPQQLNCSTGQGTLTEGEGSVQLTSSLR